MLRQDLRWPTTALTVQKGRHSMPKKAEIETNTNGVNFDIEQVAQTSQKSVAAIAHLHSRVFRDAMKFNAELMDFARRRIGADIETSDRLTHCDSVTDAIEVMTGFYQNAFHDYTDQSTSMIRAGTMITAQNAEETVAEATRLNPTPSN
jgi:hypothetical protein